jgi:hypothetical protein
VLYGSIGPTSAHHQRISAHGDNDRHSLTPTSLSYHDDAPRRQPRRNPTPQAGTAGAERVRSEVVAPCRRCGPPLLTEPSRSRPPEHGRRVQADRFAARRAVGWSARGSPQVPDGRYATIDRDSRMAPSQPGRPARRQGTSSPCEHQRR